MKTASIATASGFSSEASFFRNFKAIAGMTPREWIGRSQLIDN
jgi:transcriptional regulator GlxA family with amidase domain